MPEMQRQPPTGQKAVSHSPQEHQQNLLKIQIIYLVKMAKKNQEKKLASNSYRPNEV